MDGYFHVKVTIAGESDGYTFKEHGLAVRGYVENILIDRPLKMIVELQNHPLEQENRFLNLFHVNFPGCSVATMAPSQNENISSMRVAQISTSLGLVVYSFVERNNIIFMIFLVDLSTVV